ncbi:hypothetical protein KI387_002732, partial [Taxus chinensis]
MYLINRGPSSALDGGIPEEAWYGKKFDYSFLRVFGCEVFVHIDKDDRTKLEAKSEKCTFIGYGGDEFGFKCWSIKDKKIIWSRDVVFNEIVMYKQQLQENREESKKEYAVVEDLPDGKVTHESVQEPTQQESQTPTVRRSSR